MDKTILTGQTQEHLTCLESSFHLHSDVVQSWQKLKESLSLHNIDLKIASSFRDYERQLLIWNEKVRGKRPVLSRQGVPLNIKDLSPEELAFAILRWSAIPGTSRHHWGTEIDVYDGNALSPDQKVELTPSETLEGGAFWQLHSALDELIESNQAEGFYRPYEFDTGGVSPERWHLSHRPTSSKYQQAFTYEVFKDVLQASEMELKDILIQNAQEIFDRFIQV